MGMINDGLINTFLKYDSNKPRGTNKAEQRSKGYKDLALKERQANYSNLIEKSCHSLRQITCNLQPQEGRMEGWSLRWRIRQYWKLQNPSLQAFISYIHIKLWTLIQQSSEGTLFFALHK